MWVANTAVVYAATSSSAGAAPKIILQGKFGITQPHSNSESLSRADLQAPDLQELQGLRCLISCSEGSSDATPQQDFLGANLVLANQPRQAWLS